MEIREERPEDYAAIHALVKAAFAGVQHADGNEQDLVAALRKEAAYIPGLALVAEETGRIVGHVLFTKAQVGSAEVVALAPLAVLPAHQGKGVGSALIQAGHKAARALGYAYSVVLGSADYYPRFGYVLADTLGILPPFEVPRENFMACKLTPSAPAISGTIVYAKAFGLG